MFYYHYNKTFVNLESLELAKSPNIQDVVVGLDVGRSGVKLAFHFMNEVKCHFIPSVVMPAKAITYDTNKKQTADNTVVVDGREYFVGETAIEQGASQTVGLSNNWLDGIEHKALLLRSKRLLSSYGITPKLIVAGLPVETFESHAQQLFEQVSETFECAIQPVPQPWGVFQDYLLNDDGCLKKNTVSATREKFAVIDVGHYTTDILLMSNLNWIQESSGSSVGMYKAVSELKNRLSAKGVTASALECQTIIRDKQIKEFGQWRDVTEIVEASIPATADVVVQETRNLLEAQARTIDHILVAGGGASCVVNKFKDLWPQTTEVEDPRYSVVRGMRKYGVACALNDKSLVS